MKYLYLLIQGYTLMYKKLNDDLTGILVPACWIISVISILMFDGYILYYFITWNISLEDLRLLIVAFIGINLPLLFKE